MRIDNRTRSTRSLLLLGGFCSILGGIGPAYAGAPESPPVVRQWAGAGGNVIDYIELTGLLDPPSARFLFRQLDASERAGSSALVIRVDSRGSVGVSPLQIVRAVQTAGVPVVVWVAPGEARAHSASAYMAAAADIAVMAPNAGLGPATPALVVNSTTPLGRRRHEANRLDALLREKANRRQAGRLGRVSLTAAEAEQAGLVDFRAASLQELLAGLGSGEAGKAAAVPQGPFTPRFHKMSLFDRLLHGAGRAPAAYLLMLGGIFAILFELYNPGVGGSALSGGIAAGFSLYGFSVLPTFWPGVALMLAGLALLSADLQASRLGPLTAGGLAASLGGSLLAFAGAPPAMRLPWWAVGVGIAGTLAFYFSVMPAAIRSRVARPLAGAENIVGTHGVARTDVAPEGQVMARGTLWRARTLGAAIPQGSSVEIKGVAGLMLMVEQASAGPHGPESAHPPDAG